MTVRRLLMLTERFPPDIGGVARSSSRIARSLADVGCEVHVAAWTKTLQPGQLESNPQGEGLIVHRIGMFGNLDMSLQHMMNVLDWLHQEQDFQAVWGHYLYPAGFMSVLMAERMGVPSVVSARGNDVDRMMFPPGDFARLLWTLQRATMVTSVSAELADKISVLIARQRPVRVLRNVVDGDLFAPAAASHSLRESLDISPTEVVLGFCGELRHKKGLPFLLSALAEVRQQRDACLLVIGEVRAREQSQLTQYLADLPECGKRIRVTGLIEEPATIAQHLNLCDVFLQPSVWDGLPNAVLEAMACGRVVISSDAGGIPEVITHRESGLIIPRAQLHRLGEAILELLAQPKEQRERIGQLARKQVLQNFQPATERAALLQLLNDLTN